MLFHSTDQLFTVSIAGSIFFLAAQDGSEVLKNNLHAFMGDASFGVSILAFFATSVNIRSCNKNLLEAAFIPVCLISMHHLLFGLQLLDPYSFGHSYRGSDAGGSRFFVRLVPLAFLHIAKSISRRFSKFPMKPLEP